MIYDTHALCIYFSLLDSYPWRSGVGMATNTGGWVISLIFVMSSLASRRNSVPTWTTLWHIGHLIFSRLEFTILLEPACQWLPHSNLTRSLLVLSSNYQISTTIIKRCIEYNIDVRMNMLRTDHGLSTKLCANLLLVIKTLFKPVWIHELKPHQWLAQRTLRVL